MDEGGDSKVGDRIHQRINTFFEVDWKLWGNDATRNTKKNFEATSHIHLTFYLSSLLTSRMGRVRTGKIRVSICFKGIKKKKKPHTCKNQNI